MYTFAVPDLHGRYDLFKMAIAAIDNYGKGLTVFLGDYIDRGPKSKEILQALKKGRKDWLPLKGNHEDIMVGACRRLQRVDFWTLNGGLATLESFGGEPSKKMIDWVAQLPVYYVDKHRIFVHAGVDPKKGLKKQTEEVFLWDRRHRAREDYFHVSGRYVVHGHTPLRDGPFIGEGRANLDCGAIFTGRLVIAVFDNDIPGKPIDTIEIKAYLKR